MRSESRRGADLARLSADFAAVVADASAAAATVLVGVEHEYRVVERSGDAVQVDFRAVVHGLALGRRRLDPDDPYAYRLASGNVVTCDEREAEIVLAPVEMAPGSARYLTAAAEAERAALAGRMPSHLRLAGHSTHVSVSVPTPAGEAVGWLFARLFGADLMRMADSPDRCGIWVRPRAERLELCIDYVAGECLVAAVTFASAAVEACRRELGPLPHHHLPPLLRVHARPPRQRSGWHLDRRAFGGDPFAVNGHDPLELDGGGSMPAGDHLSAAWDAVRPLAEANASNEELAVVDAIAGARRPPAVRPDPTAGTASLAAAFGDALRPRSRPGFEVAAVALTWPVAVFLVLGRRPWRPRRAFACVPRRDLPLFLERLDAGRLDALLATYLAARPAGRRLEGREQTAGAGLFDELGLRRALLPAEPQAPPGRMDLGAGVAA